MSKALETIKHEYFGNLSIKGIQEVSVEVSSVSLLPQTWGWALLLIIIISFVLYYIYQRILYLKKYGPYLRIYKGLTNKDKVEDIYLLYKKVFKLRFKKQINDRFLVDNGLGEYSQLEQDELNEYIYSAKNIDVEDEIILKKKMLLDIGVILGRYRD
ncbi:hypothetical protein ABMA70_01160 [Halobacteriovorax sp. XZX-3]|uniref:hypothetical protein n=1 Tax=unclassified Halobacteriovorax TaxID=2639665 RepID=UPI003718B3A8